ncbi:baseplate J/gp47 family protein [Desulfosporosinus sp. Sb-LF]|uniref:baseplate J/gp47 family protein n=1 Tax=Desulfosporosinus sp. Sb-LF TaxID=2560027 RepID=UPI00107F6071|nr:baseplate J/gp47 family protein [Desulfosporosinus sp. Sb-LF]TGE33317.1 baseplate J/gp47 family protein [Desulfosporosinus sp. Sb-LF]
MFSEPSSTILNRMLETVPSDLDKSEGSFIYDALSPASQEIAKSEEQLDEMLNMVFAQSAEENGYSTQFRQRCAEYGVFPKGGTIATGSATFVGAETTPIPTSTIIQTPGATRFTTIAPAVIVGGVATVSIQALAIGSAYNVPANTITQIPAAISGITSVTNSSAITGGTNDETDSDLLVRFLARAQTPSTSGNAAHYAQWASEVNGIGAAHVYPLWAGAGTVKVVVIDSNKRAVSSGMVSTVAAYIEDNRPIGATVTVESATELAIDISATIVLSYGLTLDQVKTSLSAAITSYLASIAFSTTYVSYAKIGSVLLDVLGVSDYSSLLINGAAVDVVVGDEQVAVLGVVTLGV